MRVQLSSPSETSHRITEISTYDIDSFDSLPEIVREILTTINMRVTCIVTFVPQTCSTKKNSRVECKNHAKLPGATRNWATRLAEIQFGEIWIFIRFLDGTSVGWHDPYKTIGTTYARVHALGGWCERQKKRGQATRSSIFRRAVMSLRIPTVTINGRGSDFYQSVAVKSQRNELGRWARHSKTMARGKDRCKSWFASQFFN